MREETDISASRLGHTGAQDGTVRELKKINSVLQSLCSTL